MLANLSNASALSKNELFPRTLSLQVSYLYDGNELI